MMKHLDLNGVWQARFYDMERGMAYSHSEGSDDLRYIPAQVPGDIHLDAIQAGWIHDPCVGTNALAARWIEECYWVYRRTFESCQEAVDSRHVWLNFEGLDYYAVIYLNGIEVGRHENTFYPCRIDVAGKLRLGKNLLVVQIEGGLYGAGDKPGVGFTPNGVDGREKLTKRPWLRKPQFQFRWDWATRLINVGIFKPVRLEWSLSPVRPDQLVTLAALSDDYQSGTVTARWFVEGLESSPCPGMLIMEIPESNQRIEQEVLIRPGLHALESVVIVEKPRLWWPVGQGSQERYHVRVTLKVNESVVEQREATVGFRRVVINQDKHPNGGRYFILEINGRKIFAKGSNIVPADMIVARLDRARYETLIDRALEANFNLLRVWGGGIYESDDFFELCDEKGILVWQDFIFACGKFPIDNPEFFCSVKSEATYQIRRLASHPSLIIWCGNNEIECTDWHWGVAHGVVHSDHALFHVTLPRLLAQEDGTRPYFPSSPFSPDFQDPDSEEYGDQHHWQIGIRQLDFRQFRKLTCRFLDEAGALGPTSLPTMLKCLPEGQRHMGSLAWQLHDNIVGSTVEPCPPDEMVRIWLGLEPRQMNLEQYVYWAGLLHGEALRELCENFRWRMFDCAAAVFWMYNDCWPVTRSWTIVDYDLHRTPAFHAIRRAFSPVHLILVEQDHEIAIYGVNDTPNSVRSSLRYGLFTLAGCYLEDARSEVELLPGASTRLATMSASKWTDRTGSMPFATLNLGESDVIRGRLFSELYQEMQWPKANISVSVRDKRAIFESDSFVWNVCLDLDGEECLADNFFDIYPSQPYSIPWNRPEPPRILFTGNSLPETMKEIPVNMTRELKMTIPF